MTMSIRPSCFLVSSNRWATSSSLETSAWMVMTLTACCLRISAAVSSALVADVT